MIFADQSDQERDVEMVRMPQQQQFGGMPQQQFGGMPQQFGGMPQQQIGGMPQQQFGGLPQQRVPQQMMGGGKRVKGGAVGWMPQQMMGGGKRVKGGAVGWQGVKQDRISRGVNCGDIMLELKDYPSLNQDSNLAKIDFRSRYLSASFWAANGQADVSFSATTAPMQRCGIIFDPAKSEMVAWSPTDMMVNNMFKTRQQFKMTKTQWDSKKNMSQHQLRQEYQQAVDMYNQNLQFQSSPQNVIMNKEW